MTGQISARSKPPFPSYAVSAKSPKAFFQGRKLWLPGLDSGTFFPQSTYLDLNFHILTKKRGVPILVWELFAKNGVSKIEGSGLSAPLREPQPAAHRCDSQPKAEEIPRRSYILESRYDLPEPRNRRFKSEVKNLCSHPIQYSD